MMKSTAGWKSSLKKAVTVMSEINTENLEHRTKLINIITVCRKAGKLGLGFDAACESAEKHKAKLLFTASDVSPKTEKEVRFAAEKYKVPYIKLSVLMDDMYFGLGKRIGVASVCDDGFAKRISEIENGGHTNS